MDVKELYLSITQNSHIHTLKGIQASLPKIISSHWMEKLLKKGNSRIMDQLNSIQVLDIPISKIHPDLQIVLTKHQQAFEALKGLPPL